MPLEPFDKFFRDVAQAEPRLCKVNTPEFAVPCGPYLLREFYCTEMDCDCRRVLVQFVPFDGRPFQVTASINYGWEKAKYYRKWSRVPELWREMAGATLESFAEQGPHALQFLEIFKRILLDPTSCLLFVATTA